MLSAARLCVLLLVASTAFAEITNKNWWQNTVFYQIYPRSLKDSNADGVGDLKGIISKLHYIASTGISAVWLSPIYPSPQVDFGYDISDFIGIDPTYGSLEDFNTLLQIAKKLGLKVVLDLVPNHTSDQHPWFQKALQGDLKYKNYYVWANGTGENGTLPPNNWISVFGGSAWEYSPEVGEWYLHQFAKEQPDLDYYNPEVREEMENVLKFWLDRGIDGFRVDSTPYMYEDKELRDEPLSHKPGTTPSDYTYLIHSYTTDLIETYELFGSWRKYLDDYADQHNQDQKLLVMEAYTNFKNTTLYYKYGALPFNFQFVINLNKTSTAPEYKESIDLWINALPKDEVANWVMGNHDNPRVFSRYPGRGDQMTMLSMILPGLAVTYNGDEIGMVDKRDISWEDTLDPQACIAGKERYQAVSRDPERTPFQWDATKNAGFSTANTTWLPVNENYKELNLANQLRARTSHYKTYKTLALMHRFDPALTKGSYRSFTTNNDTVLGVVRKHGKRYVVLLINFSDDESQLVDLHDQKLPHVLEVKTSSLNSGVKDRTKVYSNNIDLPAKAAVVYTTGDNGHHGHHGHDNGGHHGHHGEHHEHHY